MELADRKRQVLYAVVQDFIVSAEPVGSNQVAHKKEIGLSSATIRTVMAELEERGFLKRPHASAGRIPTDAGYRFYVDQLMRLRPLNKTDQDEIRKRVESGVMEMHEILRDACRLVSNHANQAGIAIAPKIDERNLQHIQFCKLRKNLVLAILVSSSGIVENKILELDQPLKQSELDQIHNYLNAHFAGQTVANIRQNILLEMKRQQVQYDLLLSRALAVGEKAFSDAPPALHIEGQSRLFSLPDFADIEKMQRILRTLEEKTSIVKVLDRCLASPGVKIFIGEESAAPEINGLTLIASVYSDSEGNPGLLGVIGPTRLDYARIVPLVDFTSKMVTDVLQERRP